MSPVELTHCTENLIYVFPKTDFVASVAIPTFMCLCAIYIFPGSVHMFGYSKINIQILEIYKILVHELGNRTYNSVLEIAKLHSFISGNT